MAAEKRKFISLTHFINPQLFWYHKIDVPNEGYHEVMAVEQQLEDLYKQRGLLAQSIRPPIAAVVAVNFLGWNKLIRARVDHIAKFSKSMQHSGEYIMWALDYGFPFQTKPEHIYRLPKELARHIDHVKCGGLMGVLPAEKEFDFMEGRAVMTAKEDWCQRACDTLEKVLSDAESIEFVESFEAGGQTWGELIVINHTGSKFQVSNYLKDMNLAIEAGPNFRKKCATLKVTKISPWLSNSGNIKYGANRAYPYSVNTGDAGRANISLNVERDDYAKRKVEDWCARNQRVVGAIDAEAESTESAIEAFVDDISFEDSVSISKFMESASLDAKSVDQHMGLAGVLTRARKEKYSSGQVPPKPNCMAFEMSAQQSTTSTQSRVSMRKQKLLEMRKQVANKLTPSLKSEDKTTDVTHSDDSSAPYKYLVESTMETTPSLEIELENKMRKTTLNEIASSSSTVSDTTSVPNTHVRRHIEARQKQSTSSSSKTNVTNNKSSDPPTTSKRMEALKKVKQMYSSTPKHNEKDEVASSVSAVSFSHAQHLIKLRKKYTEKNIKDVTDQMMEASIKKEPIREEVFAQLPSFATTEKQSQVKEFQKNSFNGLKMIPAGFDLANLNRYKDEENHWHRKKTTRHDHIPHDDMDLSSSTVDLLNFSKNSAESSASDKKPTNRIVQNQNFRHTRSHNDKYKTNSSEQYNILDTTVPILADEPINFQTTENNKSSIIVPAADIFSPKEHLSLDNSCSTPNLAMSNKRRKLKSPATQMSKIDEILRRADLEKEMGNTDILDLSTINTSCSKTDSDNTTELYSAEDGTSNNSNDENVNKMRSSNKSALVEKRLQQQEKQQLQEHKLKPEQSHTTVSQSARLTLQQAHLIRLEERITCELNGVQAQNAYKIELPLSEELLEVDGEHRLQTKFIDHLVLAHSKVSLDPLTNVSDAVFLKEIHDEMQSMRVTKLYRIQAYAWPHLLRGNSLFIVNPTKSGKTWSYLPATCNFVSYRVQNNTLPQTFGPVAIILVPSSEQVEIVNSYCKRLLLGGKTPVSSVPSSGVRNSNDVKIQLFNSCGILVATPASLLRLLQDNEKESLIDPARLQHLVIDDMDLMLSRSQSDFESVLKLVFKMCKKVGRTKPATLDLQLVVTSRDWDSMMVAMIRRSNQPLLLIGDFLEAAVYGKVKISIKLCSSEQKIKNILGFIERYSLEQGRLLILCNSDDDVQEVVQALTASAYICIGYNSQSTAEVLATVEEWKNKKVNTTCILVCADTAFPELQIQNVHNLIHYSMPTSWTKFTARFSALAKVYDNYVRKDFEHSGAAEEPTAHSMILLDEENSIQLPRLMDFMKKHDQLKFIHSDILAVSKRVLLAREEARICTRKRICPYVLEFGECDEVRCDYRHNLTRFDMISKSDHIPTTGDMRVLILKVLSPTHYAARLLQHKSPNSNKWREIRRSSEVCTFGMQLNLHYMNRENWVVHWPLRINDLCIHKVSDTFQRARVLEVPEIEHEGTINAVKVTVHLIDQGSIISYVKSDELFICHEKFKEFPEQSINIRLMGVVPFDNERTWDSKATKSVQQWIMTDITEKKCVHVSINFALANTIWVNNVIVMEQLPTVGQFVYRVNLKRSLIEKDIGTVSDEKRHCIRDVAEEFGLLNTFSSSESEVDFESCNGNDTTNLIKFSSNEDDTLNSDETKLEVNKKIDLDLDIADVTKNGHETTNDNGDEENWDNEDSNGQNEVYVPLPSMSNIECKNDISSDAAIKEEWCKLPLNQVVKVEIGDERENGNWADIYLQCIEDEHMCQFEDLMVLINEHIDRLKQSLKVERFPESWFQPMQNCIIRYDERYLRAKLYGVFGGETSSSCIYRFFLCDYACFATVKNHELYDDFLYPTTKEIVEYMPFQAVHCTLAGIKWDRFAKSERVTKDYLFAYAVTAREQAPMVMPDFKIHSFGILLYECETESNFYNAEMLNTKLVNVGVAEIIAESKHYLDVGLSVFDKETIASETVNGDGDGEVCSFQELMECIQRSLELEAETQTMNDDSKAKMQKVLAETKAICSAPTEQQLCNETKSNKELNTKTAGSVVQVNGHPQCESEEESVFSSSSSEHNQSSSSLLTNNDVASSPPPELKALHKRPQTTWYETDCLIFLSIHAPDVEEYSLEVTHDTVYFAADFNGHEHVLILNLLGTVDPRYVSHEIRGLNVIVRLVKRIFMKWPRLLQQSTKYPWLTYNFNAMNTEEMEQLLPQQCLDMALQSSGILNVSNGYSSEDSDDGERNLFQTFTPIINSEDIHDPTVEIF